RPLCATTAEIFLRLLADFENRAPAVRTFCVSRAVEAAGCIESDTGFGPGAVARALEGVQKLQCAPGKKFKHHAKALRIAAGDCGAVQISGIVGDYAALRLSAVAGSRERVED